MRPGRPLKKPHEKREKRIDLRVSGSEKRAFELAAAARKQDLSVWVRAQLLRAIRSDSSDVTTRQILGATEASGVLDFWNDPEEDIYSESDGDAV